MSHEEGASSIDLIRWTFTINPAHCIEIEGYLLDLGLDVLVQDDSKFVVAWDEPDRNGEDIIEAIWELNGEPFEVTQEDFHRVGLHALVHHAEDGAATEAA